VSWELPAHYHLQAVASADPAVRSSDLVNLTETPHASGRVIGSGGYYVLKDTGQEGLLEARYRLAQFNIEIAERPFSLRKVDYPPGSWIIPAQAGLADTLRDCAANLGLDFTALASMPNVPHHSAKAPRLGIWVPWADTDSIGNLHDKVDVILYGHVDLELAEQIHGIPKEWGPMPYKKTAQTPSHGTPAESDDITGGIGLEGFAQLQHFVESGGLLVTLGSASTLAIEGGLIRGVRRDSGGPPRSSQGGGVASAAAAQESLTRTPGAHLRVTFAQPDHPIAYGYAAHTYVFRQNFPLYSVPRRWLRMAYCTTCLDGPFDSRSVVLEWGDRSGAPFLVSGQVWGEANLIGRPAILDTAVGHGHIVAFNFNPLHRDLNRGDQRMLWNALVNWQAILAAPPRP
jgi:hypothetical protein